MPLGHGTVRLCGLLQTQGDSSHHVMSKGIPQEDGFHFPTIPHSELLQATVSGNGVHAFHRCGPVLVDGLGFVGSCLRSRQSPMALPSVGKRVWGSRVASLGLGTGA